MRSSIALVALATATAGCHVASSQTMSDLTRARSVIEDRMPGSHPSKGALLIYASTLDQALSHPGDAVLARATRVATNCLGLMPEGHLPSDTREAVDDVLMSSPERRAAYRRYVIDSSSVALTPEEIECRQQ